jgi:hypothetical protein
MQFAQLVIATGAFLFTEIYIMQTYRRLNWLYLFFAFTLLIVIVAGCGGSPAKPAAAAATTAPTNASVQATATPAPAPTPTPIPPSPTPVPPTAEPTATPAPSAQPPTETATAEMQATEPADTPTADSSAAAGQPNLPTPADAKDLVYSADAQEVTYTSPSDVKTLVKFYRQALPGQGWEEDETAALVNDNLGSLEFSKGDSTLSFMMVSSGAGSDTQVSIDLSGLAAAAAETPAATAAAPAGAETLKAEDKDGLPVPDNYTNFSSESSPYRQSVTATSPSALKAVLEFYRRELPAGKWQEVPGGAQVTDTQAILKFENKSDQAHLVLGLTRNADGGTDINLATKLEGAAKQADALPPSGQARIYLGNITDGQVVFTINQKEIKVGVQSPNPTSMKDIPFVDVAPGEYDFSLAIPGQTPVKDKIKVGPDETWALVAGPGGALPVEMY